MARQQRRRIGSDAGNGTSAMPRRGGVITHLLGESGLLDLAALVRKRTETPDGEHARGAGAHDDVHVTEDLGGPGDLPPRPHARATGRGGGTQAHARAGNPTGIRSSDHARHFPSTAACACVLRGVVEASMLLRRPASVRMLDSEIGDDDLGCFC